MEELEREKKELLPLLKLHKILSAIETRRSIKEAHVLAMAKMKTKEVLEDPPADGADGTPDEMTMVERVSRELRKAPPPLQLAVGGVAGWCAGVLSGTEET